MPIKKQENFTKIIQRIKKLEKNRQYLEAIFLLGTVLESIMIDCISYFEKEIKEKLEENKIKFNIEKYKKINKKGNNSLWLLKEHISCYVDDEKTIKELEDFILIRNRCVHKILVEDEDTEELEKIIESKFSRFYTLPKYFLELEKDKTVQKLQELTQKKQEVDQELELVLFGINELKKATKKRLN